MPFTMTMPKLSPTMEEGTIAKWHKAIGDYIEIGDVVIEVATDKATVEHTALDAGWLRKIIVAEGETASVNQAIAIFTEKKDEDIADYKVSGTTPPASTNVASEKIEAVSNPSEKKEISQATRAMQQPAFLPEAPLENYEFQLPTEALEKRILASPLAKKIARQKGLDLSTVKGTGPGGRITSHDLARAQPSGAFVFGQREKPTFSAGIFEEESLTPMRKVIAQRLQESKTFVPHFYVTQTIDAQALMAVREQLLNLEVKISYNDLIVRAVALALRQHPIINSGFNSVTQKIIRFKTIDISIAVSIQEGLITPIIRHADYKNVGEISLEIRNLAKRAKEGKLAISEYKGGSFTISNLGMYGISDFQAIINPPQAAILAVGGILDSAIVKNAAIVAGKTMSITLSVDHRVIDGVAAAEFIKTLQKYLENPAALLI